MIYFDKARQRWVVEIDRILKTEDGTIRLRKRKSLAKGTTETDAALIADAMEGAELERILSVRGQIGWDSYVDSLVADKQSWIYSALAKCRNRCRMTNRPFSLTAEMLAGALRRTRGRCEVTGMAFRTDYVGKKMVRPYMHSIDQIKPGSGYTPDNIRIVCFAVNMAMSNWGEGVFAELATGYVFNKYSAAFNLAQSKAGAVKKSPIFSEGSAPAL